MVAKLNIDEAPEIARRYDVRLFLTLAVFQRGKIVQGLVGAVPKARLAALLDAVLHGESAARVAG
jgi:thioredoxin 1